MKLNCGCGKKYVVEDDWVNIDFIPADANVKKVNLLGELPFAASSVDVVFSSHMLEHFTRSQAEVFLKRCYRIMKKGGIVRIVVPDLEDVCKEYLRVLELAKTSDDYSEKYKYVTIELLDQISRKKSGGEMLKYWLSENADIEYIKERTGFPEEFDRVAAIQQQKRKGFINKILGIIQKNPLANKYMVGRFMFQGEVHQWMYDRYSLPSLLQESGFNKCTVMKCAESDIPNWGKYGLEVNADGSEYKPHSIYVEAVKEI